MRAIFATVIFLSSFLLFLVQPIIGKFLLPRFGGSSSVWSMSLMFFMVFLLFGYWYADRLSRLGIRKQIWIHRSLILLTIVLVVYLFFLWSSPLTPRSSFQPARSLTLPEIQVLVFLVLVVGMPYFLLTTTSSMLQAWYIKSSTRQSPYPFYAVSNFASLLAVASYPFLIEPFFSLNLQGKIWGLAFLLTSLGLFFCSAIYKKKIYLQSKNLSLKFTKVGLNDALKPVAPTSSSLDSHGLCLARDEPSQGPAAPGHGPRRGGDEPTRLHFKDYFSWIYLSFLSSVVLLSFTSQLTQGIAAVPFLWLLPLSLYLLSFVLAFSGFSYFSLGHPLLAVIGISVLVFTGISGLGGVLYIAVFSVVLFLICMLCHGRLYELRPPFAFLTKFYLMIALGGALGGVFATLVSPIIFDGFWEFYLSLFLSFLLAILILRRFRANWFSKFQAYLSTSALFLVLLFGIFYAKFGSIISKRNFYGVVSVREEFVNFEKLYRLYNGRIVHGAEFKTGPLKNSPITYYGAKSGIGLALRHHPKRAGEQGLRVGVLGLGVGNLAAYCKENDYFRFYEINPEVVRIASSYFSFLKNCLGKVEIVEADARLALEKELKAQGSQEFDILVMDAFTDDSIPIHLLTFEAFQLYLSHLEKNNGVLAINISNNHLDLTSLMKVLAESLHLEIVFISSAASAEENLYPAHWVLLAKNPEVLSQKKEIRQASSEKFKLRKIRPWTDNYSNLFQTLRFLE